MKIGILGGIGPFSSAYFYSELVRKIAGKPEINHNMQFPQIIINSIPSPELENNVAGDENNIPLIKALVQGVRELAYLKPQFIVMVCNTVHLYLDQIKKESGFHAILNLPEIVRMNLNSVAREQETICVLGSAQTVRGELYKFSNYSYSDPSESDLVEINNIIHGYTSTGDFTKYSNQLYKVIEKKQKEGVKLFILSCTELSLLAKGSKIRSLDTLECLLDHVVTKFMTVHMETL